jgi:aconitate hydratase
VHLERFARPGRTLLGSDSHTPTAGGVGSLAIGVGGLDVAMAMAGRPFYLTCPEVIRVRLKGRLSPWVAAKDIILRLLSVLSTRGNVGKVIEYSGPGVASLSVPERATCANMGAELGVTTSIFPSDRVTRDFLRRQGRKQDWRPLAAEAGAAYARTIAIDLAALEPLAACPHSPDNVRPVRELAGVKVDQVIIGSCTNGSYRDIMLAAKALEGRRARPEVSFIVAPGSRQALQMAAASGALTALIRAGARIAETVCGFCIGAGHAPGNGAVSVRTNNRNFEGRSGCKTAQVYLVSTETAVACALTGEFTDPRKLGPDCPLVRLPRTFLVDDSMVLDPPADGSSVQIKRGPNIGEPPRGEVLPEGLDAEVAIKVGDKVTTDHIMPAGDKLKYRSNVPKYAEFVFEPVDPTFARRCIANRDAGRANVIVAGESYGQGSSREHAALCPMYLGVRAVIARSIERIHAANLVNAGIVPLRFTDAADYARLNPGDRVEMPGLRSKVAAGEPVLLVNHSARGETIALACDLAPRQREIVLAGGLLKQIADETR